MTPEQMLARIAELEAALSAPPETHVVKPRAKSTRKVERNAEKARHAQFRLEAFQRKRLGCSLNRYAR